MEQARSRHGAGAEQARSHSSAGGAEEGFGGGQEKLRLRPLPYRELGVGGCTENIHKLSFEAGFYPGVGGRRVRGKVWEGGKKCIKNYGTPG